MALKQNRGFFLLLVLCSALRLLQAQTFEDSALNQSELTENDQTGFNPLYHFSDSEQIDQREKPIVETFDQEYWSGKVKNKTYKEIKDTLLPSKPERMYSNHWILPSFLKYLWLLPVMLLLVVLIYRFMPMINSNRSSLEKQLIIRTEDLDEAEIRSTDFDSGVDTAIKNGDYQLAFRLRYLSALKRLIEKNLVFYKKEFTNYEYVLQLSGKEVFEIFRSLTIQFDGIWYGDRIPDEEIYKKMEVYFIGFNQVINKN